MKATMDSINRESSRQEFEIYMTDKIKKQEFSSREEITLMKKTLRSIHITNDDWINERIPETVSSQ